MVNQGLWNGAAGSRSGFPDLPVITVSAGNLFGAVWMVEGEKPGGVTNPKASPVLVSSQLSRPGWSLTKGNPPVSAS